MKTLGYDLFAAGRPIDLNPVCPKTKLQSPSDRALAPLNSGSFGPFRLKVVSDAARSRRYEIGLR